MVFVLFQFSDLLCLGGTEHGCIGRRHHWVARDRPSEVHLDAYSYFTLVRTPREISTWKEKKKE